MSQTSTPVPDSDPLMVAWKSYTRSEEYQNAEEWLHFPEHRKGSMWNAFLGGWTARRADPATVVEPPATTLNPNPAAAAHAGEPQAGEKPSAEAVMWLRRKYWHYCETERKHDAEISAELLHFLDGPELTAGGALQPTSAMSEREAEEWLQTIGGGTRKSLGYWLADVIRSWDTETGAINALRLAFLQAEWELGGATNETGKEPQQAQVTGPQSNRQHAGEGKAKTAREDALLEWMLKINEFNGAPIMWLSRLEHLANEVLAERAPLVGREREPQPDLSDQIAMGMEKGRKLAEEAKKIRHGGGTLT